MTSAARFWHGFATALLVSALFWAGVVAIAVAVL